MIDQRKLKSIVYGMEKSESKQMIYIRMLKSIVSGKKKKLMKANNRY
jgi:hypothetical protein